jgi:GT2 family glycosyltransferase
VTCPLPGKAADPPCTEIEPVVLVNAINDRLSLQAKPTSVSCVITAFKPPAERLNKCVTHVLNQVDEIVITKDASGVFPNGMPRHPKIRYVTAPRPNIGYGRNANHGVRHTNGNWILLLNDDCFLAPDAVKKLLEVGMRDEKIGLVGHLTRYPDGRICHGGKIRPRGSRSWALVDNRQHHHTIREPRRLENVSGTSVLVRREAFYKVNGFDEDFFLYCEDDALNLALQESGYEIWYTPHATGIHEEAVSNSKHFNMSQLLSDTNKTFERKWGKWLDLHKNKAPYF